MDPRVNVIRTSFGDVKLKDPLPRSEIRRLIEMPWVAVDWRSLIASDRDKIRIGRDPLTGFGTGGREHTYVGGPPPIRIKRMQLGHETRARKSGVDYDIVDLRIVYEYHKGLCGICGLSVSLEEFTIDHVVPICKGGPHLFKNLQLAHLGCNCSKGDS